MGGYGSGGLNRLSPDEHWLKGTWRRDRHGLAVSQLEQKPTRGISAAMRRQALAGLDVGARRIAVNLLDRYDGWDAAALVTLRHYARSCERLVQLEAGDDHAERRRELRSNLSLLKALALERER